MSRSSHASPRHLSSMRDDGDNATSSPLRKKNGMSRAEKLLMQTQRAEELLLLELEKYADAQRRGLEATEQIRAQVSRQRHDRASRLRKGYPHCVTLCTTCWCVYGDVWVAEVAGVCAVECDAAMSVVARGRRCSSHSALQSAARASLAPRYPWYQV